MIGTQLNVQEARHREGMEDQLGALGLAWNAVIWWNSLYIDAAVGQLREQGFPVTRPFHELG